MAKSRPQLENFLCLVSEWTSFNSLRGLLGNAYPIFSLTKREVVSDPTETFPNPGSVFLLSRGELKTWDFVILKPSENETNYNNNPRACFYVSKNTPIVVDRREQHKGVAVLIEVPAFDPEHPTFEISNPRGSVTPLFFIRSRQRIFGPLFREQVALDRDRLLTIRWSCAPTDSILHEFASDDLERAGVVEATFEHPEPTNLVVENPINLLIGPVESLSSEKTYDTIPDTDLVSWYLRRTKLQDESLHLLAKNFRTTASTLASTEQGSIKPRMARISELIGTAELLRDERHRLSKSFVESPEGKSLVERAINQEVQRQLEAKLKESQEGSLYLAHKQKLDMELAALETSFREQKAVLEREVADLNNTRTRLHESIKETERNLDCSIEQFSERMQAVSPIFASLLPQTHFGNSDLDGPSHAEPVWHFVEPCPPVLNGTEWLDEAQYVEAIRDALAARGVGFTKDFIANVFACLKASQLILITSPPGYGKSMLVRELATCLGHRGALLEAPVRRSWSDDRHLLGFYDVFHRRYEPGDVGLATHLVRAHKDWTRDQLGLYFVLLDEFNLAAPEYYFSQLLQLLTRDDDARQVRLFEAGPRGEDYHKVALHPNIRFWGTINYDETTERLSPRLLDRTGVIFLQDTDCQPEITTDSIADGSTCTTGISAKDLFQNYRREAKQCPEEAWDIVRQAIDVVAKGSDELGSGLALSPRSRKALQTYMANASGILSARTSADFAFQQRILPLMRGRGPQFDKRLEQLLDALDELGLTRSAAHIRGSVRIANSTFGEVDVFAY